MAINWDEVNQIERITPEHTPKERSKIAPSVQEQLNKFDKLDKRSITEGDFHQDNEEVMDIPQRNYFQKALRTTLRWQSFCQTNP